MHLNEFAALQLPILKPGEIEILNYPEPEIYKLIKSNCSKFLSMTNNRPLYHGFKHMTGKIRQPIIGFPKAGRSSVEGEYDTQHMRVADKFMAEVGFTALRSNSLFCNGNIQEAKYWGRVYKIFPMNGFTYAFSTMYTFAPASAYDFSLPDGHDIINRILPDYTKQHSDVRKVYTDYLGSTDPIKALKTMLQTFLGYDKMFSKEKIQFMKKVLKEISSPEYFEYASEYFVDRNGLQNNTNISRAIKNSLDIWIHGTYIGIPL
jgi:hypothetical protein